MCDLAADTHATRQLLVVRVFTVKRVRQLNSKYYFYQMLKENPELLNIYPDFFFFNDTAPPEFYTLSLPDALPISRSLTSLPSPSRSGKRYEPAAFGKK